MSSQFPAHNRPRRPEPAPIKQNEPPTAAPADLAGPVLYTPTQAADLLQVRESWLRRKAAARQIPCTFLGKHLRFSPTDLATIITLHARPATGKPGRRRTSPGHRGDLSPSRGQSVDASRPDDHDRDGSGTYRGHGPLWRGQCRISEVRSTSMSWPAMVTTTRGWSPAAAR
jgi:excisionase family DNA binding protein